MILLIDNYDSFVYNIYEYARILGSEEVVCKRNDEITLDEIRKMRPSKIILSPGPKHPRDSGICLEILRENLDIELGAPILGVCLGHQAIGLSFGGEISRLQTPRHGKSSKMQILKDSPLFSGLPREFDVMRYHSLYVSENTLPKKLEILAKSADDGIIMAFRHKTREIYGVQFHPESYFTQYGKKIIANFLNLNQKENKMSDFAPFMTKLQKNYPLDSSDYEVICESLHEKDYDIVQLAGLLVLISEKSLYPDSLTALVKNILKYSNTFVDDRANFDIVGTGGDKLRTINISTATAFILAAMGVRVSKHGNGAITSKSGSSDVLRELGVKLNANLDENRALQDKTGLMFLHAPFFHPIVGEVREVRNRLKIGSVFNVLGPLLDPNLNLRYQIMGNYLGEINELLAKTLLNLGREHAIVAHGMDGMDEISLCDETLIHEVKDGRILEYKITPEQFGFNRAFHKDIEGGSARENADVLRATLRGEISGAKFDIVILNAMFGLYVANKFSSPMQAKEPIIRAIKSGAVWEYFQKYIANFAQAVRCQTY